MVVPNSRTIINKISNFTTIDLEKLAKRNYIPPINLREKLLKKYSNNPSKYVILNTTPSVTYILKYKIFNTNFLDSFKERKQILLFIKEKYDWDINPNTLTTNLKRINNLLIIEPNPNKKIGNFIKQRHI